MASEPFIAVREFVKGVDEAIAKVDGVVARSDAATLKALKVSQRIAKTSIKSGMRGRPRWDRRGAIGRDKSIPAVNLNLTPHHVTKTGGPGRLTGHLSKAVGGVRRPKKRFGEWHGGVGVGGPKSITNLYRKKVDDKQPFMRPGVKKAEPKIAKAYEAAWAKATET